MPQLEYLCLNENKLKNLNFIYICVNLKHLYIDFNEISEIDFIGELKHLETLSLCCNQIPLLENLPENLKKLLLASNLIEKLEYQNIVKCKNLEEINLSNNLINNINDIYILESLKCLKSLYFSDINFGESPITNLTNYRVYTIHCLPQIEILDCIYITDEEKEEAESIYKKKTMFYTLKIKNFYRSSRNIFQFLKMLKKFFILYKKLKMMFFLKRINMLNYLEVIKPNNHNPFKLFSIKDYTTHLTNPI